MDQSLPKNGGLLPSWKYRYIPTQLLFRPNSECCRRGNKAPKVRTVHWSICSGLEDMGVIEGPSSLWLGLGGWASLLSTVNMCGSCAHGRPNAVAPPLPPGSLLLPGLPALSQPSVSAAAARAADRWRLHSSACCCLWRLSFRGQRGGLAGRAGL